MFRMDGSRINLLRLNDSIVLYILLLIFKSITFHFSLHLTDFLKEETKIKLKQLSSFK